MNRFSGFNAVDLVLLWAALDKQRIFWEQNPGCLPPGGDEHLESLKAEIYQAWQTLAQTPVSGD